MTSLSTRNTTPARHAIRTRAVSAASLADSAAAFDDFQHVVTSVSGYSEEKRTSKGRARGTRGQTEVRRYIGFTRGRISESGKYVPLDAYFEWLDALNKMTELERPVLGLFDRYSRERVEPPAAPEPRNVLIDFGEASHLFESVHPVMPNDDLLDVEDACQDCELDADGNACFMINANGIPAEVGIHYDRDRGIYLLESVDLTERYRARSPTVRLDLVAYLNKHQSLTVVPTTPNVVYVHGFFVEPNIPCGKAFDANRFPVRAALEPLAKLQTVTTEKGKRCKPKGVGWEDDCLFDLIDKLRTKNPIVPDVIDPVLLVCDDLGTEVGDFILCDKGGHRVAVIHAKAASAWKPRSGSALQEICAQATKNVAFLSMFLPVEPPNLDRWHSAWKAPKIRGTVERRIRLGPRARGRAWQALRERLRDPRIEREVWLFLGATLSKRELIDQLAKSDPAPECFHMVLQLQNAMATVASMGARLRVFCSP